MKIINPDGTVTYPFGEPVTPEKEIEMLKKEKEELNKRLEMTEGVVYEIMQKMFGG